jgi:hypothetical protein
MTPSRSLIPILLLGACAQASPPPPFDGQAALALVERQVAFGPRVPGTDPHHRLGVWLDSMLTARADTLLVQSWIHVSAAGDSLPLRNFIARYRPGATHRVLFLAHWDTRPRSDGPGLAAGGDSTLPIPGANDGGSGTAVLLELARVLESHPPPAGVGVDLLLVDGEDYGHFPETDVLLGSKHYAANLPGGTRPVWAVLFDLVGAHSANFSQESYSQVGAPKLVSRVWDIAQEIGHGEQFPVSGGGAITDDHVPLQQVGIPAINIIDERFINGPIWHTPDDTPDKVSARSLAAVGEVALALLWRERP